MLATTLRWRIEVLVAWRGMTLYEQEKRACRPDQLASAEVAVSQASLCRQAPRILPQRHSPYSPTAAATTTIDGNEMPAAWGYPGLPAVWSGSYCQTIIIGGGGRALGVGGWPDVGGSLTTI